jgi:hypothetical protein
MHAVLFGKPEEGKLLRILRCRLEDNSKIYRISKNLVRERGMDSFGLGQEPVADSCESTCV